MNKIVERNKENIWLKIDNAGLIYPAASSDDWNSVYRVSVYLKKDVIVEKLQEALNVVIERFPTFDVTLRRGFFWYYFESINIYPCVEKEEDYPCRKVELNQKKHLFRILYYKNKVSFETFHSLTDGSGAIDFLNCLIACYFEKTGEKIDGKNLNVDYKDKPSFEEAQDSFKKYTDNSGVNSRKAPSAYQAHGTPDNTGKLGVITGVVDCDKLHLTAKQHNATITQFLVSVYAMVLIDYQQSLLNKKKPIVISVPINLRKHFHSHTMRNFSSWINVAFDSKHKSNNLADLISTTKVQMEKVTNEYLIKNINSNIRAENNFFVRIMPLFIKNFFLKLSYKLFGENQNTSTITNLGKISLPTEFDDLIERYDCLLGKGRVNTIGVAVASFNNKLSITFTSKIKEHIIERDFFRFLEKLGISCKIYCNIK